MIKTIAQMKNPRRGHDAQGRLKEVNIDASAEGYSNFMAPMRMTRISRQVDMIKENTDDIYTDKILRPATDTFLTAEWDEMIPFPNSKLSFSFFPIRSNYLLLITYKLTALFSLENPLRRLRQVRLQSRWKTFRRPSPTSDRSRRSCSSAVLSTTRCKPRRRLVRGPRVYLQYAWHAVSL